MFNLLLVIETQICLVVEDVKVLMTRKGLSTLKHTDLSIYLCPRLLLPKSVTLPREAMNWLQHLR